MSEVENNVLAKGENSDSRVYELGYLLLPTVKEDDISVAYGNLKDLVSTLGGEMISDEMPRMIPLAYSMMKVISNVRNKFNTAYFGWVKFYMEPAQVLELKKKLDLDTEYLRFLITKTVKENTIAAKRFVRDDISHRKPFSAKKENEGPAPEINKEEIDKEIDAMVAV